MNANSDDKNPDQRKDQGSKRSSFKAHKIELFRNIREVWESDHIKRTLQKLRKQITPQQRPEYSHRHPPY